MQHYVNGYKESIDRYYKNCGNCKGQKPILVDSTPTYMKVPFVWCRARKLWDDVKIIVLLRDPTERAIS